MSRSSFSLLNGVDAFQVAGPGQSTKILSAQVALAAGQVQRPNAAREHLREDSELAASIATQFAGSVLNVIQITNFVWNTTQAPIV